MSTRMSMLSREVSELRLPLKNSSTTLPYRTQSVCSAPEQLMPNALLSGACTMGRTLPQGDCHFFVGVWRLRHAAATRMGGKEGKDARISAIVMKWKTLWYLQLKRGGVGLTAMLALSHSPGAPTAHGYDHIARSNSSKARISTTKQHLGNYFADVKPELVPDLPMNHVSTQTTQAHFGTDQRRMSKTHKCERRPRGPLFGQYAMKKKEEKKSVLPKQGISGLRHRCSGSSKLPSLGRVTLFNEPSTSTSNAAITRGRLTLRH